MKSLLTLLISLLTLQLQAQDSAPQQNTASAPNALYVEAMGNGVLYSLNYDRKIFGKGLHTFGARVGLGLSNFKTRGRNPIALIEAYGLRGNNHQFEYGLGLTFYSIHVYRTCLYCSFFPTYEEDDINRLYLVPRIGYRYQKPEGGFVFRAGFTPLIFIREDYPNPNSSLPHPDPLRLIPWGGLSFGYAF